MIEEEEDVFVYPGLGPAEESHIEALKLFYNVELKEVKEIMSESENIVDDVILPVRPDYETNTELLHTAYAALAMRMHILSMITQEDRILRDQSVKEFNHIADDLEKKFGYPVVNRPDPTEPKSFRRLKLQI